MVPIRAKTLKIVTLKVLFYGLTILRPRLVKNMENGAAAGADGHMSETVMEFSPPVPNLSANYRGRKIPFFVMT